MRVYAVAMTEVQEDSVLSEADAFLEWDDAVDAADSFMMRCVGDFYEIDPACEKERRAKLEDLVWRETDVFRGMRKLDIGYEDLEKSFILSACVQEKES